MYEDPKQQCKMQTKPHFRGLSKLFPPPSPPFGQLVQLFSNVEIQYFKVSLGLKILYILYNIQQYTT